MSDWLVPGRYDFSVPEAQRLSDLTGVDADLDAVIRVCARCVRLMDELGAPPENSPQSWLDDFYAIGDLTFAAVIRYGRTLSSGVRQGIPQEWIDALPPELSECHRYFKALRDKYIAHSVSELEDNQVFVILRPQFAEKQEVGHITVDRGYVMGLRKPDVEHLGALAANLKVRVEAEIKSETQKVLEIARKMPIEGIRARFSDPAPIPSAASTFKVRGRFA